MSGTSGRWIVTLEEELQNLEAEIKALKHDIERHIQTNTDLLAENNKLREALEKIANMDYRGNRSQEMHIAYKALK